jgi:hypothetical protein
MLLITLLIATSLNNICHLIISLRFGILTAWLGLEDVYGDKITLK